MESKVIIVQVDRNRRYDIEIPLEVSAETLIRALYQALSLPGIPPQYIRAENPIAFISGNAEIKSYGLHDASVLYIDSTGGAK